MASKAIYFVVSVAGIATASGAAWWYQKPKVADPAPVGTASPAPGAAAKPPSVEAARVELARLGLVEAACRWAPC